MFDKNRPRALQRQARFEHLLYLEVLLILGHENFERGPVVEVDTFLYLLGLWRRDLVVLKQKHRD